MDGAPARVTPMQVDAWIGLARDGSKALKEEFSANDANRIKMWLSHACSRLKGALSGLC